MLDKCICSDRILTFGIRSIRSPAKVGLVITKLLTTSPIVSWRGWETHTHTHTHTTPPPPPQHHGSTVILCSTTVELRPLSPWCPALRCLLMVDWCLFDFLLEYFPPYSLDYVKRIANLSWGGESEMRRIPVIVRQGSPPHLC